MRLLQSAASLTTCMAIRGTISASAHPVYPLIKSQLPRRKCSAARNHKPARVPLIFFERLSLKSRSVPWLLTLTVVFSRFVLWISISCFCFSFRGFRTCVFFGAQILLLSFPHYVCLPDIPFGLIFGRGCPRLQGGQESASV